MSVLTRGDRRVLLMRIGALGDVLLTRRLTYSLALAGYRTSLFAPARHARVLAADPWIDRILDSESPAFGSAFGGSWPDTGDPGFDTAVVLSRSPELGSAAMAAASRAVVVPPESIRDDESIAVQFARGVSALAAPFPGDLPSLPTDPRLGATPGAIVLHSGSGSRRKNWPVERFVALGRALRDRGERVLWTRGPAEEAAPAGARHFEILDAPPLPVLAATLATARAFVGNDSGVSHLAGAVGVPTLAIFGPTNDAVWRPDGSHVRTLRAPSASLAEVSMTDVLEALLRLLSSSDAESRSTS